LHERSRGGREKQGPDGPERGNKKKEAEIRRIKEGKLGGKNKKKKADAGDGSERVNRNRRG